MKEACKMWFSVMCSLALGMLLIFGAYLIGSATQTHVTFIVERLPITDSYEDITKELTRASIPAPPSGIEITAKPLRKPPVPKKVQP